MHWCTSFLIFLSLASAHCWWQSKMAQQSLSKHSHRSQIKYMKELLLFICITVHTCLKPVLSVYYLVRLVQDSPVTSFFFFFFCNVWPCIPLIFASDRFIASPCARSLHIQPGVGRRAQPNAVLEKVFTSITKVCFLSFLLKNTLIH